MAHFSESKIILVSPPDRAPGGGLPAQEGRRQQEEAGERSEGETEPGGAKDGGAIVREEERPTESRSGERRSMLDNILNTLHSGAGSSSDAE